MCLRIQPTADTSSRSHRRLPYHPRSLNQHCLLRLNEDPRKCVCGTEKVNCPGEAKQRGIVDFAYAEVHMVMVVVKSRKTPGKIRAHPGFMEEVRQSQNRAPSERRHHAAGRRSVIVHPGNLASSAMPAALVQDL